MDEESVKAEKWPSLAKDDADLLNDLFTLLSDRVQENAYAGDGKFAAEIKSLPVGLRAMAATHWIDISLTLDSVCWHYRNFGEPSFVALSEAGLRELGLSELADVFHEAGTLMMPLASSRAATWDEAIEKNGLEDRVDTIDRRGWDVYGEPIKGDNGTIYSSWIRYAHLYPERVFG
jgi:hypothetical protein